MVNLFKPFKHFSRRIDTYSTSATLEIDNLLLIRVTAASKIDYNKGSVITTYFIRKTIALFYTIQEETLLNIHNRAKLLKTCQ